MSKKDENVEYVGEDEVLIDENGTAPNDVVAPATIDAVTPVDGTVDGTIVDKDALITAKEAEATAKKLARATEMARMRSNVRSKKVALLKMLTDADEEAGYDAQYIKDIAYLIGEERGTATRAPKAQRIALRDKFVAMFGGAVGTVVTGLDLFYAFGLAKDRLNLLCAEAIKKVEPADRSWITGIPQEANPNIVDYKLVGVGENAPEGWTGFLPEETL